MELIKVEGEAPDQLRKRLWAFGFDDRHGTLRLAAYFEMSRPTKRHHYRVDLRYSLSDMRNNTIAIDDVPLPDGIKQKALGELIKLVIVTK